MSDLKKRLYANWMTRLGSRRVSQILRAGAAGLTADERATEVVDSNTYAKLDEMVFEGFGQHYHQSVFLRRLKAGARGLRGATVGTMPGGIRVRSVDATAGQMLMLVPETLEFLPTSGPTFSHTILFPAFLTLDSGLMRIHVMTMKCSVETWSWIVGSEVRRLISTVTPERTQDAVLSFLDQQLGVASGDYVNYSSRARRLLQQSEVDTFSGEFEVRGEGGPSGKTRHDTLGELSSRKRRPLREAMPDQFDRFVGASRIYRAEVKLSRDHRGLKAKSTLVLHPALGKVTCRANLKGGDLHGFLATLA